MSEIFRDNRRRNQRGQQKAVRLFLEELEARCLLSGSVGITSEIATDPNGNMWFFANYSIVQVNPTSGVTREIPLDIPAWGMAAGSDGGIWLTGGAKIERLDPITGTFREFDLPAGSEPGLYGLIMAGPDGNLWFDTAAGLDRINPATGAVQEVWRGWAWGMTVGPDGNIWLTGGGNFGWPAKLTRLNPQTGATQEFEALGVPGAIVTGTDGNLWYLDGVGLAEFNLTTKETKEMAVPAGYGPGTPGDGGLAVGADGKIWFNASNAQMLKTIGDFNPFTGSFEVLNISHGGFWGIAAGPDGNIWFSESFSIGQYDPATGTYRNFSLAIPSTPSSSGPANGPTVSNNSVSAQGTSVSATAGVDFRGAVATFTPQTTILSYGEAYQATIEWGDGTTSGLVLTVTQNGTYDVIAGHTYQTAGTYSIKVTIGNYNPANPLGDNAVTVFSTANANDPFAFNM